jgi:prepilin-type N-terminal cleavage/methylation domain-containing protein
MRKRDSETGMRSNARLRSAGRCADRLGHTLAELLITLAVMATIATFALPRVNYVSMRLDGAARTVRSTMQQAWRMSVQKQHDIIVSFDTAGKRIRILEDSDNNGSAGSGERISWRPLEDNVRFERPPAGINGAASAALVGSGLKQVNSMPSITFRRNGSTSGDVEIYLSAQGKPGKEWRAVTVVQATGRSEWFKRVNNAWRSGGM